MVFDVIPDAVGDFQKLISNLFCIVDGILVSPQLNPPEVIVRVVDIMTTVGKIVFTCVFVSPGRRDERLGPVCLPRLKEAAEAHGFFISSRRLDVLLKFAGCLPADPKLSAAERSQDPIARAVCKIICFHCMPGLSCELPAFNSLDSVAFHLQIAAAGVKKQGEIFLKFNFFVEDAVPNGIAGGWIAVEVFQFDFLHNPGFPIVVAVGAANPHPDLRRSVPS